MKQKEFDCKEIEEIMLSFKKPRSSVKEIKSRPDWRVNTKDVSAHRNQTVQQTTTAVKTTKAASRSS